MSLDAPTTSSSRMTKATALGILFGLSALALSLLPEGARAQTVGWEARWDGGMVDSSAQAMFVTTGPTGTIFATGTVRNGSFRDILTLAWSASGELLWHRSKGISADSDDVPAGIVVDGEGRVVVAGTTKKSGTERVVVFVYDPSGNELWSRTHPLASFRVNHSQGLALGPGDQILVAAAIGSGSIQGTSLMSFDSNGDLLWERQRNIDPAYGALAVGPGGVVAVAGRAVSPGGFGFLTVAFDPAGNELWARTKSGPAGGTDSVKSLIVDGNGRFVVTGSGSTLTARDDFMTVAYDAAGNEIWTALKGTPEYEGPTAIAADGAGNVYVVGVPTVATASDYTLAVSYDSAGAERWAVTSVGPPDSLSTVSEATISAQGDLIVAGSVSLGSPPIGRLKVTSLAADSGATNWEEVRIPTPGYRESAVGVSADLAGALVVVGGSWSGDTIGDVLAVRYDSSGTEVWARKEPLIPAADVAGSLENVLGSRAIAAGYEGRLYITGTSFDGRSIDYLTLAYDGFGHKLWEARKSNPNDYPARPSAIAVDPASGNVYVTGTTLTHSWNGYLTVAYDRTGAEIWSRTRLEDGYGSKSACCVAVDSNGRIFVSGRTSTSPIDQFPDLLTIAYEPGGNEVWSDGWGLSSSSAEDIGALVIGSNGAVYVAGTATEESAQKALVLAYDAAGNRLWSQAHAAAGGGASSFFAAGPTADGGLVAAGRTATLLDEILTVAYRPDGSELWSSIVGSEGGRSDSAWAVAEDAFGRTFVAGVSFNFDFSDSDFRTLAIDPYGSTLWARTRGGIPGENDFASSLAINSRGAIFVTGASGNGMNSDFLTVAYSVGGHELFEYRYDGGSEDSGYLSVAGPAGSVFVGGTSTLNDRDYFLFQLLDQTGLFADGFESGDGSLWSALVP